MIVVLTGDNSFALRSEVDKLVSSFTATHGDISLERIDGETMSFERIQESLQSVPFLADKKLVVLRSPSLNKQFAEQAERLLGSLPETTDVLLVEPKLDKRGSYYKFLKKHLEIREYMQPDESGMVAWVIETVQSRAGSISSADARFLVERVGVSQQLLAQEIEKLLIYATGVTHETIIALTESTPQGTIFELLEAAFAGNIRKALELYSDQRAQKVDVTQIIAMLAWQLRIVAFIKAAQGRTVQDIATAAKLSPFVVRKTQAIATRLSLTQVKQLVADLLLIDTRSKRERIDTDESLRNFLMSLSVYAS